LIIDGRALVFDDLVAKAAQGPAWVLRDDGLGRIFDRPAS
jgi:hypothetical protein